MTNKKQAVSDVFASYVKIAQEKGMISDSKVEEAAKKIASAPKKADLTPTEDVNVNILKLCAGLRELGLHAHAESLEKNFISYKRAESAEYSSKDMGEKLVDDAHPEGSPEVTDADDGHGVVENILKEHADLLKIVEKDPDGKLASAEKEQILNSVKLALGAVDFPEWARTFSKLVQALVIDPLYEKEPYYSSKLKGGRFPQVKDYFSYFNNAGTGINRIPDLFEVWAQRWETNDKDLDKKWVLGNCAKLINEYVFDLLAAMKRSVLDANFKQSFNPEYIASTYGRLAPLAETFNGIFTRFHGNAQAAAYHERVIDSRILNSRISNTINGLDSVILVLDQVLKISSVQGDANAKTWLEKQKSFVLKRKSDFTALLEGAINHEKKTETLAGSEAGFITIDVIKNIVNAVNSKMLKDRDLKFGSIEEFLDSLKSYPSGIMKDCRDAMSAVLADSATKRDVLSLFGAV